jgi:copper(I)-binding protein
MGAVLGMMMTPGTWAHEYKLGDLSIDHPWTRATVKGQPAAGAFLAITNHGTSPDRLLSVDCPLARVAELHSMSMDNGVMRMRALPDGIDLPPGQTVQLAPGGLHVMLVGPSVALVEGQRIPLSLTFEKAGTTEVELAVEKAGAKPAAAADDHDHAAGS